ncbi:MAG: hypothetical protein ACI9J3_000495 [Parvicellaceae bacterium]|jgi:hypothetical protein
MARLFKGYRKEEKGECLKEKGERKRGREEKRKAPGKNGRG